MLPSLGDTVTGVSEQTLATVPRYLHTLRSYIFLGSRRFFLQSEMSSEGFTAPWLFFLTNVSIGAALAAGLVLIFDDKATGWDWDLYKVLFISSLVQDVLLLPCGLIAAWFAVQRVTAETLLTAYAYASAWRIATMPAIIYIFAMIDGRASSALLFYFALAMLLAYYMYLILGMAAHNFIEGRPRWSFAILCTLFFGLSQTLLAFVVFVPEDARNFLFSVMAQRITGKDAKVFHCDNAVINGTVQARDGDAMVWFEWGDSPALGQTTPPRHYLDDGPAFEPLVNLCENTKYYYRIAVKSTYGVSHGKIVTFMTPPCNKPVAGSEQIE